MLQKIKKEKLSKKLYQVCVLNCFKCTKCPKNNTPKTFF